MLNRKLAVTLSLVVVVLAAGLVLYYFGGPQAPADAATSVSSQVADGDAGDTTSGAAAPDDSPLAIQIPGCVCHSDDPQLVEEHATYRMNECFGCHADGTPAMGN